jgi:putative transposase
MGRPKEVIGHELEREALIALEGIKESNVVIKLQAIVSCARHPVSMVADILGKDRITLLRWITSFRKDGVDGLRDKKRGHNPSKLNDEQKSIVYFWVDKGLDTQGETVHWTLKKLLLEIEKEFGIKLTKTPLWIMLRSMGFRMKVPRRTHIGADKARQEEFKKNRRAGR